MTSKADNLIEVQRMMAGWTLLQRVRFVAQEMDNLNDLFGVMRYSTEEMAWDWVREERYEDAIKLCDGDYEPPDDPDAWSGGFAPNH